MSEGRTSAAQADVEGEDHPVDGPAETGADDVTGSAATNGHESTTSGTDAHDGEADVSDTRKSELADEKHGATEHAATDDRTATEAAEGSESEGTTETVPAATLPGDEPAASSTTDTKADTKADEKTDAKTEPAGDEEWADAEDKAYRKEMRKGFAFGTIGGILVGAIVALLLGALVWPGYLLGPGDPQGTADQITQALSAKDSAALDGLSCKGPNGAPVTQLSPQVLQFITKVAPAGPTTTIIDTEARTPVDLTLSAQGQTQTLPSELVLGETGGDWCLKGLAQRQQ